MLLVKGYNKILS